MKRWIVENVRRLVGIPALQQSIAQLATGQAAIRTMLSEHKAPVVQAPTEPEATITAFTPANAEYFGDSNLWELPIQICARDFLSRDSVVLDIGGNIGGLATAFSKIVPQGRVYTFEPNPQMWPTLYQTLELNGCNNVTIVPLACFSKSLTLETFYSEPGHYKAGSRLGTAIEGARRFEVVTVSIDDFCSRNTLRPDFIKIDVEGAEIHVLRSAQDTIRLHQPAFIFEYRAQAENPQHDPINFLKELDCIFFDTNTYDRVTPEFYLKMPHVPLVNVVAIPAGSQQAERYLALKRTTIVSDNLTNRRLINSPSYPISQGRYIVAVDFEIPDFLDGGIGVQSDGQMLAYYGAKGRHLKDHSSSSLVIDVQGQTEIAVVLFGDNETGATYINTITITQLTFQ